jgi:NAD(P)-dependent dehydrogenase (short-subunit alcohol dehydrogenase family)
MTTRKRVLVTGASRGIGRAALTRLREDGYQAIGVARTRPADLEDDADFHCCDLDDLAMTQELVTRLANTAPFYGLVNNAAIAHTTSLDDTRPSDMEEALRVNVSASLVCAQALVPGMRELGAGRIVNLSSRAALGKINRTAYSATKAAVIGMSRTWALELAPSAITVNVIAPGPIATEMFHTASPPEDPRTQALMAAVPLQRVGTPEEVAHLIAFLLDDRSGFVTGQTLHIDGGLTTSNVRI